MHIQSVQNLILRKIRRILNLFGVQLTRYESNLEVTQLKNIFSTLVELAKLERAGAHSDEVNFLRFVQENLHISKSQILQDLFVLYELREKENGYFVEFGAANGVDSSNSFVLEKNYNWCGILAEPARIWHEELKEKRRCKIDYRCVWSEAGRQLFNEVSIPELSTINCYSNTDHHFKAREIGAKYYVETISLNELLESNDAPLYIDYLSIDTEGSEPEILNALDFEKYQIKIITCEHNYTQTREKIYKLLTAKGYVRKFEVFSLVDDWYVKP